MQFIGTDKETILDIHAIGHGPDSICYMTIGHRMPGTSAHSTIIDGTSTYFLEMGDPTPLNEHSRLVMQALMPFVDDALSPEVLGRAREDRDIYLPDNVKPTTFQPPRPGNSLTVTCNAEGQVTLRIVGNREANTTHEASIDLGNYSTVAKDFTQLPRLALMQALMKLVQQDVPFIFARPVFAKKPDADSATL